MTDKSEKRARELAAAEGISYQAALNRLRRRVKQLVNRTEQEAERLLEGAAGRYGARVAAKPRLADVFDIENSGISDDEYSFALKSHVDFLVTDDKRLPLFGVEVDGGGHNPKLDAVKNALFARFDLPLARVRARHLKVAARGLDCVSWLAELFFTNQALDEAHEAGSLPWEEDDPMLLLHDPARPGVNFPLMLDLEARVAFREHHKLGHLRYPIPFAFETYQPDGSAVGFAVLGVGDGRYLTASEAIYLRGFGTGPGEASGMLTIVALHQKLGEYLRGGAVAVGAPEVYARCRSVFDSGSVSSIACASTSDVPFTIHMSNKGKTLVPAPEAVQ